MGNSPSSTDVFGKNNYKAGMPCSSGLRRQWAASSATHEPLRFHHVHGDNVEVIRDGAVARRHESFCKGIAFSQRPVRPNECVFLRLAELSTNWSGVLRLGFTNQDPATLRGSSLPKYACPDLTNRPGFWAKALAERVAERQDAVLCIFVNGDGEVHYGLDDQPPTLFFAGVDVRKPLWLVLDIYGNTVAVELLDPRQQLNNARGTLSNASQLDRLIHEVAELDLYGADVIADEPDRHVPAVATMYAPLPFHRVRGANACLSGDRLEATRPGHASGNAYAFTSRPVALDERFVLRVVQTNADYVGALDFGLTSCNPDRLDGGKLPDDCHELLDRMEYWVVLKDVARDPKPGDELAFVVSKNGEVQLSKNGSPFATIMHVDATQKLWAFFDVCGSTQMIRMLGCPVTSRTRNSNSEASLDNSDNECMVCCERPVNSVLYTCGHMCMCFECAQQLHQRPSKGQCPICRADIQDVIRTFRP